MSFAKNVVDALNIGEVVIEFTSLNSGRTIKGKYTLKGRNIGLNPNTEVIVACDVENNKWQDIKADTITHYINAGAIG